MSLNVIMRHTVLMAGAIIVLVPFLMMISYSTKSSAQIEQNIGGFIGSQELMVDEKCVKLSEPNQVDVDAYIRKNPSLDMTQAQAELIAQNRKNCQFVPIIFNYSKAFTDAPLLRYFLNGIIVTVSIFLLQILIALPAAYAFSKLKFWGRDVVFAMVIVGLLVPTHTIALPLYLMFAKAGLINTYGALIIPYIISVFGIFLMRQFFMTVPDDLVDAARMDGMNEFSIVWRVMMPTAIPALLAFGIFSVTSHWNDYFWPRIVITGDRDLFTPPLGMREFRGGGDGSLFGPLMATATTIVIPLIVVFLLAQKRFIQGITLSGMK